MMTLKESLKIVYRFIFRGAKSYSQLGEDLIVSFFLPGLKKGSYVDIGANNPVYLNNTYLFYKKGWSGLCIEPNSLECKLIRQVRPRDQVLNIGLGAKAGEMDFYILNPDTLSTFSSSEAERMKGLGHKIAEVRKVPVKTLAQVLEEFNRPVDLLTIDTEGMDLEILKSNNWEKYRPKIIIAETIDYHGNRGERTNKLYDEFLSQQGYIKLADTHINGIYAEKSYAAAQQLENILT